MSELEYLVAPEPETRLSIRYGDNGFSYVGDEAKAILKLVNKARIDSYKKSVDIVYSVETFQMAIDELEDRIAELRKGEE